MKHLKNSALLIFSLALPFSCATQSTNGIGGRVKEEPMSLALQKQGIKQFENIKRKKKISTNRRYNSAVQRVGSRLSRAVQLPGSPWEFVVFEDSTPNAFALPGRKIGVNTGIFKLTQDDAGLAAVIGHEMAHVTAAHAQKQQSRRSTVGFFGTIVDFGLASRGVGVGVRQAVAIGNQVAFNLPYSRSHETEADRVGTIYMARAGYDPRKSLDFWRRFAQYNNKQGNSSPEFLRTHPLSENRLRALQEFMPTALSSYTKER